MKQVNEAMVDFEVHNVCRKQLGLLCRKGEITKLTPYHAGTWLDGVGEGEVETQ